MMNKVFILAAAAALAEPVLGFNSHRHGHQNVERQDVVTVYETVVVVAGQEGPAPTPEAAANQPEEVYNEAPVVTVVPTPENFGVVAPAQTTLATAVRPADNSDDVYVPSGQAGTNAVGIKSSLGFSKRGMAYNDVKLAQTFGSKCTKCGWAYNWDSESYNLDTKYSFVPMLWGNIDIHTSRWKKNCDASIARGSKAILSFNEPDHAGQAAMTPQQAAAAHAKWMNPYGGKVLVGAPAVTNSGNPGEGLQWLQSFMDACKSVSGGCKVDFCPVHWYSEAQYGDTLFTHLQKAHEICGNKPVWLTEFAPLGSSQQKTDFLQKYMAQLDALSYLDAYAYFMVAADNLMSGTSALSQFGQKYATF